MGRPRRDGGFAPDVRTGRLWGTARLLLLGAADAWVVAAVSRTQAAWRTDAALAAAIVAVCAGVGRCLGKVPGVGPAAGDAATDACLVTLVADPPMGFVGRGFRSAIADLLAALARQVELMLIAIFKIVVLARAWPLPVAGLGEELHHHDVVGLVGEFEGRASGVRRAGPGAGQEQGADTGREQEAERDSRHTTPHRTLH